MIQIELPLPPKSVHPNARPHWAEKARGVKRARTEAAFLGRQQAPKTPLATVTVQATFHMPRRQDGDNLNAWLKPYLDGLQDAGIVANDSGVRLLPPEQVTGAKVGRKVVLTIEGNP